MKRRRLSLFLFLCLNKVKKRNTSGKLWRHTILPLFPALALQSGKPPLLRQKFDQSAAVCRVRIDQSQFSPIQLAAAQILNRELVSQCPTKRRSLPVSWPCVSSISFSNFSPTEQPRIMREIVHIQAGQCGNQIGAKVRNSFKNDFFYH